MTIIKLCRKIYKETVEQGPYEPELKRFLKAHERVPLFIDNLARELQHVKAKRETVEMAVRDMTHKFCWAAQKKKEIDMMSPLQKAVLRSEADRINKIKKGVEALERAGREDVITDKKGETSHQIVNLEEVPA